MVKNEEQGAQAHLRVELCVGDGQACWVVLDVEVGGDEQVAQADLRVGLCGGEGQASWTVLEVQVGCEDGANQAGVHGDCSDVEEQVVVGFHLFNYAHQISKHLKVLLKSLLVLC